MLRMASSGQPSVGLSESRALSHAYIQYPPLRCNVPGSRGLFYDDGNKFILSPTTDQVYVWKMSSFSPQEVPSIDVIDEGPVLSIRYSLNGKVIGIQRSKQEVQFKNRETGQAFSQKYRSESESILGFFWVDSPTCDVIFVKNSGLDLFTYVPALQALQLVEMKKLNVSWYVYTHESRMVLLASGMQCKTISGFQFSSGGIIRLPRFDMAMTKAEANMKPVLAEDDVHIVTNYGRIYCLQVDRVAMLLHLYRFYRDAVVRKCSLPIYSSKIAVSVVDNVLLVHQVDAKVVILYDIFSDTRAPISAPLPLLFRGIPRANTSAQSTGAETIHTEATERNDHVSVTYGDDWTFLVPDLMCDPVRGNLWKIHLDLEAIAASSSEVSSVLEFLQRRKLEPIKAKHLCLALTRTLILERRPVANVSKAIDVLVSSYSHSLKTGLSHQRRAVGGEITSAPADRHFDGSGEVAYTSMSRVQKDGNTSKHGFVSDLDRTSQHFSFGNSADDFLDLTTGSRENKTSSSDSENINLGLHSEASKPEVEQLFSQSQMPGTAASGTSEQQEPRATTAVVSPDEMYNLVFSLIEEEMEREPAYLVAVLVEYFRSAASEKLKVHQNLNIMIIQLLARSERYAELGLFVIHKILEPSKEVALQLIDSGSQNLQTRKLGMDMLRQLSLHREYVLLLVKDGYYIEALRYARRNKVNSVRPSFFLEAAFASSDSQHVAAVLRFCMDSIPGFKNTSAHSTYCRVLNQMNSGIATA